MSISIIMNNGKSMTNMREDEDGYIQDLSESVTVKDVDGKSFTGQAFVPFSNVAIAIYSED